MSRRTSGKGNNRGLDIEATITDRATGKRFLITVTELPGDGNPQTEIASALARMAAAFSPRTARRMSPQLSPKPRTKHSSHPQQPSKNPGKRRDS